MPDSRSRRFRWALLEETRGEIQRMASIDSVAERMGMDYDEAGAFAVELDDLDLVKRGQVADADRHSERHSYYRGARRFIPRDRQDPP